MGVNCRLIACSRLRDNRARGNWESANTKKGGNWGEEGLRAPFTFASPPLFRAFPILSRLPGHYLRAWNRLVDTRHIELKERPRIKHLKWLTCTFASSRKRTQTSGSFICRFGLHWFRADSNVCDGQKLFLSFFFFLSDHLTAMSYSLFRGWTMLFITPDFLTPNNHYSFSFKPCYYSLFSFHPEHLI